MADRPGTQLEAPIRGPAPRLPTAAKNLKRDLPPVPVQQGQADPQQRERLQQSAPASNGPRVFRIETPARSPAPSQSIFAANIVPAIEQHRLIRPKSRDSP